MSKHFLCSVVGQFICWRFYMTERPVLNLTSALLVTKLSRYQIEKRRYPELSDDELERKIRKRGSDFEFLMYHHNVHNDFVKRLQEVMEKSGIATKVVKRSEMTPADVDWADVVVPVGGDGTFLMVANYILGNSKPVVGFNSDPERSAGHLCLPKKYYADPEDAVKKILNGEFRWMFRSRIRTTVSGQSDSCDKPFELQEQLLYPDVSLHNWKMKHKEICLPSEGQVLPVMALNEVFLGESLSARVSYFELGLDGGSFTKIKSSGLCVTTGTGSTSWHMSINRVDEQTVENLAHLILQKPVEKEVIRRVTREYNDSLVFQPDCVKLSYTIRDNITTNVWPYPKGIESRGFATNITVRSRCLDAGLVVDGRISYPFNDGSQAKLEIRDSDALRTVVLNEP